MTGRFQENLNYLQEELAKNRSSGENDSARSYPAIHPLRDDRDGALLTIFISPNSARICKLRFQAPVTTRNVNIHSNTLIHYGLFMLAGLAVLGIFFWLSLKNPRRGSQ